MTPLDRILEPEVMDTFEDAFEYDSMDHSQVNEVFPPTSLLHEPQAMARKSLMLVQALPKSPS